MVLTFGRPLLPIAIGTAVTLIFKEEKKHPTNRHCDELLGGALGVKKQSPVRTILLT